MRLINRTFRSTCILYIGVNFHRCTSFWFRETIYISLSFSLPLSLTLNNVIFYNSDIPDTFSFSDSYSERTVLDLESCKTRAVSLLTYIYIFYMYILCINYEVNWLEPDLCRVFVKQNIVTYMNLKYIIYICIFTPIRGPNARFSSRAPKILSIFRRKKAMQLVCNAYIYIYMYLIIR